MLHRDVKPANVLMSNDGRVVLTDFGIATVEGSSALTMTGEVIGSPEFLAPERALGRTPGPESDLWSLGVLLYAAVEGNSPFRQNTPLSTLRAVVDEELPPPRRAGPLAPVIEGLLRKDPAERISAEQAEQDLRIVGAGGTRVPAPAPRRAPYAPTVAASRESAQREPGRPPVGADPAASRSGPTHGHRPVPSPDRDRRTAGRADRRRGRARAGGRRADVRAARQREGRRPATGRRRAAPTSRSRSDELRHGDDRRRRHGDGRRHPADASTARARNGATSEPPAQSVEVDVEPARTTDYSGTCPPPGRARRPPSPRPSRWAASPRCRVPLGDEERRGSRTPAGRPLVVPGGRRRTEAGPGRP